MRLEDAKGDRRDARRLQSIAGGRRRIRSNGHDLALLQRSKHIVPTFWLDDGDLGFGNGERNARSEPTAAAWQDNACRSPPQLLDNLDPYRSLARNDHLIVEARHHGCSALAGEAVGDLLPALRPSVVENDFRAFATRALHLHTGSVGGHDDHRSDTQPP